MIAEAASITVASTTAKQVPDSEAQPSEVAMAVASMAVAVAARRRWWHADSGGAQRSYAQGGCGAQGGCVQGGGGT